MGHNLEILADGSASMAYTGKVPWHGLGKRADGLMTAAEAIDLAGLGWTVSPRQMLIMAGEPSRPTPVKGMFAITRDSDESVYGAVSKHYKPIQNAEAFDFFDAIVDSGDAKYETAGSLAGGRRVWMTAKVGDTMTINGEEHDMYLLLINSHDGLNALQAVTTMVRVVCQNTEQMALRNAKSSWSLNHRLDIKGKTQEAREALGLAFAYKDAYEAEMAAMLAIDVTVDKFEQLLRSVLPEQARQTEKNVSAMLGLYESSPSIAGTDAAGTAWGAYNALSQWASHKPARTQEARMISNIGGNGNVLRNRLHKALVSLA